MFRSFFVVSLLLAILSITEGAKPATLENARPGKRSREAKETLYTSQWAVHLKAGESTDFLKEMGFEVVGKVGSLADVYEVKHAETHARHAHATRGVNARRVPSLSVTNQLLSLSSVHSAEQQYLAPPHELYVDISDPLFSDQWHLINTGKFNGTAGDDINVKGVWDMGIDGTGILVSIVDDGYQYTHPDLAPRYVASSSRNFVNDPPTADPSPDVAQGNYHGTACAGLVLAASNSVCGVGSAYGASGAGIRLVTGENSFTFVTEANALSYTHDKVDIYSNSWGPVHDFEVAPMGTLTQRALLNNVNTGRGGLGNVYLFAAGNGGDSGDNANMNGYGNSRFVITVAAVDNNGKWVYYSEKGANLLIASPSLGSNSAAGIRTTDILGEGGYDPTECTPDFSGTSAATPIVSGVVALMLQANPKLGWRDVKYILATTATKTDPTDSDWKVNGAGYNVNHQFGFGRVNALAAVNAAKTHTNLPANVHTAETSATFTQTFASIAIPDNSATGITQTINFPTTMSAEVIEFKVVINHRTSGDLKIVVTSPQGTESLLAWTHDQIPFLRYSGLTTPQPLGVASFGPALQYTAVSGVAVTTQPSTSSCTVITNCGSLSGAIAYLGVRAAQSGSLRCGFATRAKAVQDCGAIATLFYGDTSDLGDTVYTLDGTNDPSITIPSAYLNYAFASTNNVATKTISMALEKRIVNNYASGWTFTSTRHLGEDPAGAWTINIVDGRANDVGTLSQVTITAYGNGGGTPTSPTTTATTTTTSSSASFVSISFAALLILVCCIHSYSNVREN